jgi:predicted enzyme related to lactoylglutathione lyase
MGCWRVYRLAHSAISEKHRALNRWYKAASHKEAPMRIKLTSVMVDDQDTALKFYTDVLGFKKKFDIPAGEYRWITVVSPEGPDDLELALEPNANPAAKAFQKAMFDQKIPLTSFESIDIESECARLKKSGVAFVQEPTEVGPVIIAVFADTCGNLIQLHQPTA